MWKFIAEEIEKKGTSLTEAMYVGSGCLVKVISFNSDGEPISVSTTFVPHVIILTDKQGNKTIGMP